MRQGKINTPTTVSEVLDQLNHMLLEAPTFRDTTGYFPYRNLIYEFQQLTQGLNAIRPALGDERHHELMQMSDRMRSLFEADPEGKTGETLQGCKIIHQMEDILRQVRRKS